MSDQAWQTVFGLLSLARDAREDAKSFPLSADYFLGAALAYRIAARRVASELLGLSALSAKERNKLARRMAA